MVTNSSLPQHLQSVSTCVSSSHSHVKEQIWFLINRAYQNIYGLNLPNDEQYQRVVYDAALQLQRDDRAANLSDRALLQAMEDIIRICDEHHKQAQKHLSRANNPVYIREMALDNAVEQQKYMQAVAAMAPRSEVALGCFKDGCASHSGTIDTASEKAEKAQLTSSEIMELAYQQLAFMRSE